MSGAASRTVKTRKLGRTNVHVTELGLGTAPLGELLEKIEDDEAAANHRRRLGRRRALLRYVPMVRTRTRRTQVGRALYRKSRDQYAISTKIGRVLRGHSGPTPLRINGSAA